MSSILLVFLRFGVAVVEADEEDEEDVAAGAFLAAVLLFALAVLVFVRVLLLAGF